MAKIFPWNTMAWEPRAKDFSTLGVATFSPVPVPFSMQNLSVNQTRFVLENIMETISSFVNFIKYPELGRETCKSHFFILKLAQ